MRPAKAPPRRDIELSTSKRPTLIRIARVLGRTGVRSVQAEDRAFAVRLLDPPHPVPRGELLGALH